MPNPATEKLLRILQLEARKHEDKAMIGGLVSFVPAWLADAQRAALAPDDAQDVAAALLGYSALTEYESRSQALLAGTKRARKFQLRVCV